MASTEGSREVEAARKRLAAAKAQMSSASRMIAAADAMAKAAKKNKRLSKARAQNSSASKMLAAAKSMAKTAKKTEKEARSLFERSRGEAEEAEAFLKEAEKPREVIYSGDENEEAGRRNKKRKGAPAAAAVVQPTAAAGAGSAGNAIEEIVVEGAGSPQVNGTYRRCRTDGSDALPSFYPSGYDSDCPVFSKEGELGEGGELTFFLFRSITKRCWYINLQAENLHVYHELFYTNETAGNNLPPKAGWAPICDGTHPAPQLQW